MQRPQFRHPRPGPRPAGFRSPPPAFDRSGGMFPSPPWAYSTPQPPFGPRFGQGSPNTPPGDFGGSRNGGGGKYFNTGHSPGHTPRRSNPSPRGALFRRSPYESPGRHSGYQGSPRTSTAFGSAHGRDRGTNDVEKYYKPSMLQDPWAELKPIAVTQNQSKTFKQSDTSRQGSARCALKVLNPGEPAKHMDSTPAIICGKLIHDFYNHMDCCVDVIHNNTSTTNSEQ